MIGSNQVRLLKYGRRWPCVWMTRPRWLLQYQWNTSMHHPT